jgi:two-component system sensor histidine kinase UhpB
MNTVFEHIHPEDAHDFMQRYQQFIDCKEGRLNHLFRLIKADGSTAYINLSSILVVDEQHRPKRIVSVLHDITDVRHLQRTLEQNELQLQKRLAETSVKAQEREREEIAKELHDNIRQLLATAKLMLETGMKHPDLLDTTLEKSLDVIRTAIHDTRHLSHAIMPPEMNEKLFLEKIRDVANAISMGGKIKIRCSLPKAEKFRHIKRESKLAVYRIVQEQLTNIAKYSKASEALIELKTDGYIALTIKDNGVGFDTTKQRHGLGLTNIKNRAAILNGFMDVQSSPGHGTTLTVHIPVGEHKEEEVG